MKLIEDIFNSSIQIAHFLSSNFKPKIRLRQVLLLFLALLIGSSIGIGIYMGHYWSQTTEYSYTTENGEYDQLADQNRIIFSSEIELHSFLNELDQDSVIVEHLNYVYQELDTTYPVQVEFRAISPHDININYGLKHSHLGWGQALPIIIAPTAFILLIFGFVKLCENN